MAGNACNSRVEMRHVSICGQPWTEIRLITCHAFRLGQDNVWQAERIAGSSRWGPMGQFMPSSLAPGSTAEGIHLKETATALVNCVEGEYFPWKITKISIECCLTLISWSPNPRPLFTTRQ